MESGTTYYLLILIAILAGFLVFFGIYRYKFAINPISFFAIFDIGVLTLLSGVVAYELSDGQEIGLTSVLCVSMVYMAGYFLVFIPRRFHLPRLLFDDLHNIVEKNNRSAGYGVISHLFLIILVVILFILLMQASGAGILWITAPRLAYQSYRAGAGFIYVMVQWALLVSLLYYFWAKKSQLSGLIIGVCLYSFIAYFTGSKANFLFGFILAGVYYNFFVKRIPTLLVLSAPFVVLCSFLVLLILQGSYGDILSAISYFRDYTETTGNFLMRFDEFNYQWGYGALSDLWFYVPRALYPDKPFEYGVVLIHKVLFPGAAELGSTPGILPWALAYLDFGVIGVFFSGVLTGIIRRGAYESFLANRSSVLAFVLMIQLSLIPVFAYATLPLIIIIGASLSLFMRKKIVLFPSSQQY